jgi:hypothetical protein
MSISQSRVNSPSFVVTWAIWNTSIITGPLHITEIAVGKKDRKEAFIRDMEASRNLPRPKNLVRAFRLLLKNDRADMLKVRGQGSCRTPQTTQMRIGE